MIIISKKIPKNMKTLPELVQFLGENGEKFTAAICLELDKLDAGPASSNITYKTLAKEIASFAKSGRVIYFEFYRSRNPFWGKNVISHATNGDTINYNTRFHLASSYELLDWIGNFYHELTHLVDQKSIYSFNHDGQNDYNAAPMVVARIARVIFQRGVW